MCDKSVQLCPTLCTLWTVACQAPLSAITQPVHLEPVRRNKRRHHNEKPARCD